MKKNIVFIIIFTFLITTMQGCSNDKAMQTSKDDTNKNIEVNESPSTDETNKNKQIKETPNSSLNGSTLENVKLDRDLGLNNKFNSVSSIGFYAGAYYAKSNSLIYKSKDLKKWTLLKGKFTNSIMTGDENHLCLVYKNKILVSHDGHNWITQEFGQTIERNDIISINKSIVIKSDSYPIQFMIDDLKVNIIEDTYDNNIKSNKKNLFIKIQSNDDYNKYDLFISQNGTKWIKTKFQYFSKKIDQVLNVIPYNKSYKGDYFFINKNLYGLKKVENKYKVFRVKKSNSSAKLSYNYFYDLFKTSLESFYDKVKLSTDLMLTGNYSQLIKRVVIKNNIFIFGKRGAIYQSNISKLTQWKWCGLYSKKIINVNKLKSGYLDKLGISKFNDIFIFYNRNNESKSWQFYSSSDGYMWKNTNLKSYLNIKDYLSKDSDIYIMDNNIEDHFERPMKPYLEKRLIVFDAFSLSTKLFFKIQSHNVVFKNKVFNRDLHVPQTDEEMQYLGMNGGSLSCITVDKSKPLNLLNMHANSPTVKNMIHLNNKYFAFTQNGVFESTNLKNWVKSKWKFPANFKSSLSAFDEKSYVSISSHGIRMTKDGVNWRKVLSGPIKTNKLSKPVMANGVLCVLDSSIHKNIVKSLNGIKYVRLTNDIYDELGSNGELFAVNFHRQPSNSTVTNPIFVSTDGQHWKDTRIHLGSDEDEGGRGSFELINYKGKTYVFSYTFVCSVDYAIYELIENKDSYKGRRILAGVDIDFNRVKKIKNPTDRFISMCSGILIGKGNSEYVEKEHFDSIKIQNDLLITTPFCDSDNKVYCNDKLFKLGKYGFIQNTGEECKWSWSELYHRKSLTKKQLINPKIGGALGVRLVGETLWYASRIDASYYQAYSSKDGVTWKYRFGTHSRIKISSLKGKQLDQLINKSVDY